MEVGYTSLYPRHYSYMLHIRHSSNYKPVVNQSYVYTFHTKELSLETQLFMCKINELQFIDHLNPANTTKRPK